MTRFTRTVLPWLVAAAVLGAAPAFAADIAKLTADATAGDAQAQFQLGNAYMKGDGVAMDISQGLKWCRMAAEQGLPAAQMQLGLKYKNGQGVPADIIQSDMWVVLATEGDPNYASVLRMVEGHLTPQQLHDGHAAAAQWKTDHAKGSGLGSAVTQ